MVEADALPPLVQLLSSANIDVAEQAVWAVGNIAGDHPKMRDRVLAQNALPLLCAFLERVAAEGKISPTRNGTWALSNLVRGKPQPQLKDVAPAVPLLAKLLTLDDSEVQADAAWAISYLSDGPNEMIDTVCMAGAVPRLVELCKSGPLAVRLPGIRAISFGLVKGTPITRRRHGLIRFKQQTAISFMKQINVPETGRANCVPMIGPIQ